MTTCRNFECSHYKECTINIYDSTAYKNRPCSKYKTDYQSQRERIAADYLRKQNRMPLNIYLEE